MAPLTLDEAIRRALERGFDMALQRHSVDLAVDGVIAARSEFHPVLSASSRQSIHRTAAGDATPATRSEALGATVGISQRLPLGTNVSLGTNLNRSELDPGVAVLNPAYASDATLSIRQPLLRGAGTTVNTASIRRAEIGFESAERDYISRALEVIHATETAYYLLGSTREQLAVFSASLELAQKLLEEAQARRKVGASIGLDVLQAELGVANARQNVLRAEHAVQAGEDALLGLIGRFEFDSAVGPIALDDPVLDGQPQVPSTYRRALAQQPAYLNARAALAMTELDVAVTHNALKPSLDLDLAVGLGGSGETGRGAFSRIVNADSSSWQAALTVTFPLGRAGEKARYRQSLTTLKRQRLGLKQLEQAILLEVRAAVRGVETSRASLKVATLAAQLSEQQYEAERSRFRAGLSTSRRVLEGQADLESARVNELQAKLDLHLALAALRRIEGSALEHYGIVL